LTSREILVAAALEEREPQLGDLYRWAARTVRSRQPRGWVHLVSHFVRDLLNRLPEYFDVPAADRASVNDLLADLDARWTDGQGTMDEGLRASIEALLAEFRRGGENQEDRAEAVLRANARDGDARMQLRAGIRAWRQTHRYFERMAHLRSQHKATQRLIDEVEVAARFDALTALLAVRLAGEGFFATKGELDKLAAIPKPSREEAERAAGLMRDGLADAFLSRLEAPGWLEELARFEVFQHPPAATREGGYVQAPYWAAAEYLVRIADQVPDLVVAVIRTVPEIDNERVYESFAQAALRMPATQAREVAALVPGWLGDEPSHFGLAETAAELAAKLATEGHIKPGLRLIEAALGLRVIGDDVPQIVSRVDEWHVGEVLSNHFQAFVEADPMRAAGFLIGRLQGLLATYDERRRYTADSSIDRPAIEDDAQNTDLDVRAPLLVALRDVAELLVVDHDEHTEKLLEILEKGPCLLGRLRLHLLRLDRSGEAAARRRAVLLDIPAYEDTESHHERFLLLQEYAGELPADDRETLALSIADGPDRNRLFGPADPCEPDVEARRDAAAADWQLRWFTAFGEHLPAAQAELRDRLGGQYGDVEHPEFLSWHSGWVGPAGPSADVNFADLAVDDILERLATFTPGSGPGTPSREGLGRVFAGVVESAPEQWSAVAERLAEVEPIFARHLFTALDSAVLAGKSVGSWPEVLTLAEGLVAQGPAPRVTDHSFNFQEQPGHIRAALARLLTRGLAHGAIPFACRERVWALLAELAVDPDPGEAYERLRTEGHGDPHAPATATVRGSAMEGVIVYAQWVAYHRAKLGDDASLAACPEFGELLLHRLGTGGEASAGVLAVVGASLPALVRTDGEWVRQHRDALLTPAACADDQAVWRAYVGWAPFDGEMFTILADRYALALEGLPDHAAPESRRYVEALAQHLFRAALRELPSSAELLDRFFAVASATARARLVGWIGRVAHKQNAEGLAPELHARRDFLAALWEQRLSAAAEGDEELAQFGWWYAAGLFDRGEDLERLVRTVCESGGEIEHVRQVLCVTARVAPLAPASAADLAEALVGQGLENRLYVARSMVPLLEALVNVDLTRERALAVIDELGEQGFVGAQVLRDADPGS
ncbi:MAG: hypothetical protein JWQ18_3078, partial [Conexibacter sp.]|nr:hypothetical protein [Conexibacter sp.]